MVCRSLLRIYSTDLKVLCPDMGEVGDAHEEADCVQDVALTRPWLGCKVMTGAEYVLLRLPVQSCDGVEGRVEAVNLNPLAVGLEALDHHGLDKHPAKDLLDQVSVDLEVASFVQF